MSWHYRFTPYDISGYTFDGLVDKYDKFIVAYEDKDKYGDPAEPHYHIYIETQYTDDSIRGHFRDALQIPKVGRGQGNKYSMLQKWQGIEYIVKYGDIRVVKGFEQSELEDAELRGRSKYIKQKKLDTTVLDAYALGKEAGKAEGTVKIKKVSMSKDQEIIADLQTWYIQFKKEYGQSPTERQTIENACRITRNYHKGINIYKVRDYCHTVMFEDEDTRWKIVESIRKLL